jgi:biotin synthase
MLSRVTWPLLPTEEVFSRIGEAFEKHLIKRVCVQTLNYPTVFKDLLSIIKGIRGFSGAPISVCCQHLNKGELEKLSKSGINRIGIPIDVATKELFEKTKGTLAGGPYIWDEQLELLSEAVRIFGERSVTTHLIAGLGEKESDIVKMIQWCFDLGAYPSLFSFTPVPGTALENFLQPPLSYYRRIQIAHHLITLRKIRYETMLFDEKGFLLDFGISKDELRRIVKTGLPFLTSGCPGCNRPYYNEKPGGPIYNYPRLPLQKEIVEIKKQIRFRINK